MSEPGFKSLQILVGVNASPASGISRHAIEFIEAALAAGHQVGRVFFYHDGVLNGLATAVPRHPAEHRVGQWQSLAEPTGIDLVLCVGAATRRGVLDAEQAEVAGHAPNLADGFRLAGLGQWMDAVLSADRVVQFGPSW